MTLRRDARHGARIARAEFVRSLRGYTRDARRVLGLVLAALFVGGSLAFSLPTAYALGRTARSLAAVPSFAVAASLLPVALLLLSALRTVERVGGIEAEEFVLTAVHPRAVVLGLVGAEVARLAVWFGPPLVGVAGAFALGLGTPSLVATAGLVALPLVCWAAVWGYACGIALLRALRQLPGVRRVLKAGGVLAVVGVMVASQFAGRYVAEQGLSLGTVRSAVAFAPAVDYLALAFVGTPLARPTSAGAAAVLLGTVALTPVGLAVAARQASALWFTDAPRRADRPATGGSDGFAPPPPFARARAGRVAWGLLVRAVRHPQDLSHLLMLVFFLGPVGTTLVEASGGGGLGPLVAATGVGVGTYLAGAAFGLNPLGDDRPQLPFVLLTTTTPRTVVRGRVLAGVALGVPVATLVPLASVAAGTAPLRAVAFAAAGVGACLAAAAFAVGIGSAYPVYEEREFWETETVVPSTLVMMTYFFAVGGGTVVGLAVLWFGLAGALGGTLVLAGVGAYLLVTVGVSYGSYRYAVRRYRRYALD